MEWDQKDGMRWRGERVRDREREKKKKKKPEGVEMEG